VTRDEKSVVVSLYPIVFALAMLSEMMPRALLFALRPETAAYIAPRMLMG